MAKKKRSHKKSSYKVKAKKSISINPDTGLEQTKQPTAQEPRTDTPKTTKPLDEVAHRARREVRHSLTLAFVILLGLVLLWVLFARTGLGHTIYNFVKLQ